jgi:glycine cleavage system H protein
MNIPADLKYTKEHEWARIEGKVATIGITDYAQKELGDIVFVELPKIGTAVQQEKELTTIESVKAASDLFAPLSGTVTETNADLDDQPELVNKYPYGKGWIVKLEIKDAAEAGKLMGAEEYKKLVGE